MGGGGGGGGRTTSISYSAKVCGLIIRIFQVLSVIRSRLRWHVFALCHCCRGGGGGHFHIGPVGDVPTIGVSIFSKIPD